MCAAVEGDHLPRQRLRPRRRLQHLAHRDLPYAVSPATWPPQGRAISISTGGVVLDVYAHTPALARAAAQTAVPINAPGAPGEPLAAPLSNTGFGERPLPSQTPSPLRAVR